MVAPPLRRQPSALQGRSGLRLSRPTIGVAATVVRPARPSLPEVVRPRLGPSFDGLSVLRRALTSAGSWASVLSSLRLTARAEPDRSHWVRCNERRGDPGANTVAPPTETGLRRCRPTRPVQTRFTALRLRLDLRAPTASTGHALAVKDGVQARVDAQPGFPPNVPLPPRCQVPSVRALVQDFHLRFVTHASHTRAIHRTGIAVSSSAPPPSLMA